MPYQLTCTTCSFREVVRDLDDVLSVKEAHEAEFGEDHVMRFEAVEEEPPFRGGVADDWP